MTTGLFELADVEGAGDRNGASANCSGQNTTSAWCDQRYEQRPGAVLEIVSFYCSLTLSTLDVAALEWNVARR